MTDTAAPTSRTTLRAIKHRTIRSYQWAVLGSFAFIFAGLIIGMVTDRVAETEMGSPLELLRRLADFHPSGFFGVGIGIMILAPIEMLIVAAITFLRRGDKRYAMITAGVALILSCSILLSFLRG
jgi:hypothetical protein